MFGPCDRRRLGPAQRLLGAPPVLLERLALPREHRDAGRLVGRAVRPTAIAAAAWSCVEKMLQLAQRTSAPRSTSVSMSTAVWIVMCSEPVMRAPVSGLRGPYSSRHAIRPGISTSASSISLRPHSAEREIGDLEVGEAVAGRRTRDSVVVMCVVLRFAARTRSGDTRRMHGGRPGSPDDSPDRARPGLDDSATAVRRSRAMATAHGRRRAGHARLLRPGRHDREGRRAHQGGRRRTAPALVAFPEALRPDVSRLGLADDAVGRRRVVRPLGRPVRRRARARRATRSARSRASTRCYLAIPVNERDGGTVYNTILLLRARRRAARASTASSSPTGGERLVWGLGDGSTLAVIDTPFGRVGGLDLLGELHAARARRDVRAGHRHPARADVGQLRRVGRVDAAHREGGPLLRARHHVVPARRPTCRPTSPAATRSTATTTTGCRAATR